MRFSFALIPAVILLVVVVIIIGMFTLTEKIDAGYTGIRVNLYGSERGVDDVAIVSGRVWYNPLTQEIYKFPIFMQNAVYDNENMMQFQTKEGLTTSVPVGVNYTINSEKVPELFKKFRKPLEDIQAGYLRTQIRNILIENANKYSVEELIEKQTEFLSELNTAAKAKLEPEGFMIDTITFVRPPKYDQKIVDRINEKVEKTQEAEKVKRELDITLAENAKKEAVAQNEANMRIIEAKGKAEALRIEAESQAQANELISKSLTKNLVRYYEIQKWNGILPYVSSSNALPVIDLRNNSNNNE